MDEDNTAALTEIIKYVKDYETKLAEKKDCENKINNLEKDLEKFLDTENKHVHILYSWSSVNEFLYPNGTFPSDSVKNAIKEDVQNIIDRLKQDLVRIDTELWNLSKIITTSRR